MSASQSNRPPSESDRMNDLLQTSFQPLDTDKHAHISKSLRYYYIKRNIRDAFISIILRQMRYNDNKRPRAETWVVVGSDLDATLLLEDLLRGNVTGRELERNRASLFSQYDASIHSLCIMTYQELITKKMSPAANTGWKLGARDVHDVVVWLDFGCGEVTWEMAVSAIGVARLVVAHSVDTRVRDVVACIVSNSPVNPWGRARAQRIVIEPPEGAWWKQERHVSFRDESKPHGRDLEERMEHVHQLSRIGRMVLFLERQETLRIKQDLADRLFLVGANPDNRAVIALRQAGPKHILWDLQRIQIGPVAEVSGIFVNKERRAWQYDKGRSQMVQGTVTRSKAELRLIEDIKTPNAVLPDLHYAMSEAEWDALPDIPEAPPAWTQDMMKTLLCCIEVGPRGSVLDIPVQLPPCRLVEEFLLRLERQQLIEMAGASDRRPPHRLLGTWTLTAYGKQVVQLLLGQVVQEFHVACLLGRLLHTPSNNSIGLGGSQAIHDAITMLATILEPSPTTGTVVMQHFIKLTGEYTPEFAALLVGVAQPLTKRGPIWTAVAIWQKLRTDHNWRISPREAFLVAEMASHHTVDKIVIDRLSSFEWDHIFTKINQSLPSIAPTLRPNTRLSEDEQLAVDIALVWAYLDQLLVVMSESEEEWPENDAFAVDLVSRRVVSEAEVANRAQLDIPACQELDRTSLGKVPPFIFCIYTHTVRNVDEDGVFWSSYNVTYVSMEAVVLVLEQFKGGHQMEDLVRRIGTGIYIERE